MKSDELEWKRQFFSTNHLELCKIDKDKVAIDFFEKIFNACPNKNKKYILKKEKSHDFWQSHFATKLPKE